MGQDRDRHRRQTCGCAWARAKPLVVFVAHLDEIGFTVDSILDDGSLHLRTRGGFFSSLFEAQPALVHTTRGDVPGIFLPREAARDSGPARRTPPPLRVSVGTTTRAATQGLGVAVAAPSQCRSASSASPARGRPAAPWTTASAPRRRSSRVRHLDQTKLKHQVIFIWSTREEIGLEGAGRRRRSARHGAEARSRHRHLRLGGLAARAAELRRRPHRPGARSPRARQLRCHAARVCRFAARCGPDPWRPPAARHHQRRQRRLDVHPIRRRGRRHGLAAALLALPRRGGGPAGRGEPRRLDSGHRGDLGEALLSVSDKRGIVEFPRAPWSGWATRLSRPAARRRRSARAASPSFHR